MPKKSKKSKSRRETLKHKYKVIKKVKEHKKKLRKEARKNPSANKGPKDPGIPNAWPFKQQLMEGLQASKERARVRQSALHKMNMQKREEEEEALRRLQSDADARGAKYETGAGVAAGESYVDYSVKAFYKDFAKVVEASDVIIEVLDARDPIGTRCKDVERFVRKMGATKRVVLLLNKIDLVPKKVVEEWLAYLREELPAVAFRSSTQKQAQNLGRRGAKTMEHAPSFSQGAECLGADILIQLLKNYARGQGGLKQSINVGIVGLPNVGKSSLVNSLKRSRVAKVGNQPGVTKNIQEISLDKQVTLLDSPGVVFSEVGEDGQAAAALRNCIKVETLDDPTLPISEICRRCPQKQLMGLYRIPKYDSVDEFLIQVATARGKLKRGGTVDVVAAAKIVLQDWNDGKIPYFTTPPKRNSEVKGSAAVVPGWSGDFDLSVVMENEKAQVIDALEAGNEDAFEMDTAGEVHVDLEGGEELDVQGMDEDDDGEDDDGEDDDGEDDGNDGDDMEQSDDGEMDMDAASRPGAKASGKSQTAILYSNEGQLNPKKAKQARKQRKKAAKNADADVEMGDDDSDSDFDFTALPAGVASKYELLADTDE
jgi:nuclear GTP-binding protein